MRRFGLIGRKLGHSFSPAIHAMISDYEYKLYPLEPEELEHFLKTTECDGLNVTIPYKMDVMPFCSELSDRAQAIGCVNTMTRLPDGSWRGDNTDWDGFLFLLGDDAKKLKGKKALVLGSGGASRTVCAVLEAQGIPHIVISRSGPDNYGNLEKHADAALIVNSTPVGMYPKNGASPVDLRLFPKCELVLDVVYNPSRTAIALQADELGIPARTGLSMLSGQGVRAGELFLGRNLPKMLVETITRAVEAQTKNVVLIGMPGCGKSSTARALGALTGRPVLDADDEITKRIGMPIPEFFRLHGEQEFRAVETEVLADISKLSGHIIATGGGVVTQPCNLPLIRQNSTCVWLTRDTNLPTAGRPVSQAQGIEALKAARLPLYRSWSEFRCSGDSAKEVAEKIVEMLQL